MILSFSRIPPDWRRVLCLLALAVLLIVILSTLGPGCDEQRTTPSPGIPPNLGTISGPLERIPVRQEVIARAAPEIPVVQEQTKATMQDAAEAGQGVEQLRVELEQREKAHAAEKAALQEQLREERDKSTKWYRRAVNGLRFLCLLGIAGGLVLGVLRDGKLLVIAVAAAVTLGTIMVVTAIETFVNAWLIPVAGVALVLLLIAGAWALYVRCRAATDAIQFGERAKKLLPATERRALLEHTVQRKSTKKLVDRTQRKLKLRP